MAYNKFTLEDIEDIKRYAAAGMSNVDISYVMECTEGAVRYVLKNERKQTKTGEYIKRSLRNSNGPVGSGNSITRGGTGDTENVIYETVHLPEDYDPTLEMAALLERMEREEDD